MLNKSDWQFGKIRQKNLEENKDLVTGRVIIQHKKPTVTLSIGVNICDLLYFHFGTRLNVNVNKHDRDLILLEKSHYLDNGCKLCRSGTNSNFLKIAYNDDINNDYKLSQTISLHYDFKDDKYLLINISKLRWER